MSITIPDTAQIATVALMEAIHEDMPSARMTVVTIGNGEEIIMLNKDTTKQLLVWSVEDWQRIMRHSTA